MADDADAFEISVLLPRGGDLGIKVDGDGVVNKLIPGGVLAIDGRARIGDKIISVNSLPLAGASLADVLACIGAADGDEDNIPEYRFRMLHVVHAGTTSEKLLAKVLQEKQRKHEKVLAEVQAKEVKRKAAEAKRAQASTAAAAEAAAAMRTILKASTYKLPELEQLLAQLDEKAQAKQHSERTSRRAAVKGQGGVSALGGKRPNSALGTKVDNSRGTAILLAAADTVAPTGGVSLTSTGPPGRAAEGVIFVHFIPPPLRQEGKKHLAWIVHCCSSADKCREAKHVSFHSVTGFSTFEGEPPEKAEGICCSCQIANHRLRGYGRVRWEGDHAIVEDEGVSANVDPHVYMRKAKGLEHELARAKEQLRALQVQGPLSKARPGSELAGIVATVDQCSC